MIDYPPESTDPAERRRQLAATFGSLYPYAEHRIDDKHPGMHRTETVDYAIVLEGEIVAMMDDNETVLRAGDILIQRGTNHAWANRSGKPARICFVLIDGVLPTKESLRNITALHPLGQRQEPRAHLIGGNVMAAAMAGKDPFETMRGKACQRRGLFGPGIPAGLLAGA